MNWNEIKTKCFVLVLGFILTGIVGSLIGFEIQRRAEVFSWELKRLDLAVSRAERARERISKQLDKRMYAMQRLLSAIREGDEVKSEAEYQYYQDALRDWNESLNQNLAAVSTLFFPEAYEMFTEQIHVDGFKKLGAELESLYKAHRETTLENGSLEARISILSKKMETTNEIIFLFNVLLEENFEVILQKRIR